LLLLSVGSLIGQNQLDALEGRRQYVYVAGANSGAANPRVFRCDASYLTPPTDDAPAFRARLREIIASEQPDLIFAGRDHDVPFLCELREAEPALARRLPCGPRWLAEVIQDKWQSHLFCQRHHLPFADTLLTGPETEAAAARAFLTQHGLPLIAKPRFGYGTHGTRILLEESQFIHALRQTDFVIQPYLAPPPKLREQFFDLANGWPFFFTLVDDGQFAGQAIIGPDGQLAGDVWGHCCTMINGKAEKSVLVADPAFPEIMRQFAHVFAAEGWRGPLNLQCRKVAEGQYVGFELSGRMTGTTSSRRLFGYDEIGLLARAYAGMELPLTLPEVAQAGPGFVAKTLTDGYVPDVWVRELESKGEWHHPLT